MATYKVLQDVEAEDKLIGPLTLRQVIYAFITAGLIWLSVILVANGAGFLLIVLAPPILLLGFLAIPWHGDQPTEIWALAKIRFLLKPRRRIWDQSGAKKLVTITAPKAVQRVYSNNLSQTEVRSRLHALANTIDSRGWAVKSIGTTGMVQPESDRLLQGSIVSQQRSGVDVAAADDMLDASANPVAQHFESLMTTAAATHRQELIDQMQQQTLAAATDPLETTSPVEQSSSNPQAPAQQDDYWFMHQPEPVKGQATFQNSTVVTPGVPQAAQPTADDEALAARLKVANQQVIATDHMKHIKTPEELAEDARKQALAEAAERTRKVAEEVQKAQVTSEKRAAIMNLASNDDLDVATLARQANRKPQSGDDGEVVISLR